MNYFKYMASFIGGGDLPLVIDLDQYGIGSAILGLFQQGGGQTNIDNVPQFWNEVATNKPLRMTMAFDVATIWIDQSVRVIVEATASVVQLAFAFSIFNNGGIYNVSVALLNGGANNCNVMVDIT